jgi:hypothetical protein
MTLADGIAASCREQASAELAEVYSKTGIDLSMLPPIMTADQLGPGIGVTPGALAQDRYRNQGIPYVKMGRRVRYVRAEVARYLVANRRATVGA